MTPITSKCSFKSVLPSEHEEAYAQKNVSLHFFVARIRRTFAKKLIILKGQFTVFLIDSNIQIYFFKILIAIYKSAVSVKVSFNYLRCSPRFF